MDAVLLEETGCEGHNLDHAREEFSIALLRQLKAEGGGGAARPDKMRGRCMGKAASAMERAIAADTMSWNCPRRRL